MVNPDAPRRLCGTQSPMPPLRLRPPRHAGAMSGMRDAGVVAAGRCTMRRIVTNVIDALLLLVAALVILAWLLSYRTTWGAMQTTQMQEPFVLPEHTSPVAKYRILMFVLSRGSLLASYQHDVNAAGLSSPDWAFVRVDKRSGTAARETWFRQLWFRWRHKQNAPDEYSYSLAVPLWFVALLAMTIPITRLVRRRAARQRREFGRCQRCGYDLRATPERCPECGTAVPRADGGVGVSPARERL